VARETDPRKRKAMWEKVQLLFYEDVGRIKLGDWFGLQVHGKDVRGYVTSNEQPFFNVWLAK
jgi:hypothetical protein